MGQDSSGHKSVEAIRQQHTAWRYRRQQLVHLLEQSCASWPDLLKPFAALLDLLHDVSALELEDGPVASGTSPGALDGPAAAAAVAAAARQVALSRCQLLRDMLLLLGLVQHTRCVGKRPLSSEQMQQVSEGLLPRAQLLLQRAVVAYWLSCTAASRAKPQAQQLEQPGPLAFGNLRIQAAGPVSSSAGPPAPPQDVPLSAKLLPAFSAVEGARAGLAGLAGDQVLHRAAAFVAFLEQGAPGDGSGGELSARVLQLGYELFLQKEYHQLDTLVQLAGALPEWGCCVHCRVLPCTAVCTAVYCRVLPCTAVYCRVLPCTAVCTAVYCRVHCRVLCGAVCAAVHVSWLGAACAAGVLLACLCWHLQLLLPVSWLQHMAAHVPPGMCPSQLSYHLRLAELPCAAQPLQVAWLCCQARSYWRAWAAPAAAGQS
jgi:hypothetical protein